MLSIGGAHTCPDRSAFWCVFYQNTQRKVYCVATGTVGPAGSQHGNKHQQKQIQATRKVLFGDSSP